MIKEFITLSHGHNGEPLQRVHMRIVPFHSRHTIKDYDYHSGFIKDGIHYASVIKTAPPEHGDEQYTQPNHLISELEVESD